jgi:hypothetical protein
MKRLMKILLMMGGLAAIINCGGSIICCATLSCILPAGLYSYLYLLDHVLYRACSLLFCGILLTRLLMFYIILLS